MGPKRGLPGPVPYRDKFTGKTMDRPGWNKLAKDIEAGKVAKLACWRLDRLGRTAKGLTALFKELVTRKVNLVSLMDGLDLSTPAGRLMARGGGPIRDRGSLRTGPRWSRSGPDHRQAHGKARRNPEPVKATREQDTLVRRMKTEGEPIASIARATRTVPSHNLSGSRSTRRGCEVEARAAANTKRKSRIKVRFLAGSSLISHAEGPRRGGDLVRVVAEEAVAQVPALDLLGDGLRLIDLVICQGGTRLTEQGAGVLAIMGQGWSRLARFF